MPAELYFGTFGSRGTGKTVWLSSMNLTEVANIPGSEKNLQLNFTDQATVEYLQPLAEFLERGDYPPANPVKMPNQLVCQAVLKENGTKSSRLIRCIDFAGELINTITDAGVQNFKHEVFEWFKSCNGILLFVDCTNDKDVGYRNSVSTLLSELAQTINRHGCDRAHCCDCAHESRSRIWFREGPQP